MLKEILSKLINRHSLSRLEAYEVMQTILAGEATPAQISSFVSLLTFRGITAEELIGLTRAMREQAQPIELSCSTPLVDTCGTGGSTAKTFNVSTASALVASASGLRVAKHGNRAVTSLTGSADVLHELGLEVELTPADIKEKLESYSMCFMFAPIFHQALKVAASIRREIGFRSIFNLLGPMTNPAGAKHQVLGVFDRSYSLIMAEALKELGSEHILVVAADDGLDEFSIAANTHVTELIHGEIKQYSIAPGDVGLKRAPNLKAIQVQTPQESAQLILDVLTGRNKSLAFDIISYNAGAALYVGKKAASIQEGVQLAQELITSQKAYQHYLKMIQRGEQVRHA